MVGCEHTSDNLIYSSLIHSDYREFVKMHDLVLAFVLGEVSRGNHPWIINHDDISKWDGVVTSESCKRISLTCMGMSEFPEHFKYPNLTLIQLIHGDTSLKFPKYFYENMKKLEVIAYFGMQYPLLPRSLQCSTNLKTLVLQHCELILDYSFFGDLVNLEVLSFAQCNINKLPSAIGNLRKLKLLDLTGCVHLRIDDGVFKNLEKLEELYMRVSKVKPLRFTDANFEDLEKLSTQLSALEVEFVQKKTQLTNISFKKLDRFKISIGCLLGKGEVNEQYSFQNTLKLMTDRSRELRDNKISELFEKTEILHLQVADMISLEDVVSHHLYDQQYFCYLREFKVSDCGNLKYLFPNSVACSLRKLERLTVSSCSVLEALVHNNGGSEIKPNGEMVKFEELKFLCLEKLPKLVNLFLVDDIVELPQLTKLELNGLPNFTSIFPDNNNSALQQALFNRQVKVSKLENLKIESMEKLKQIWGSGIESTSEEEEVNNISMLRDISVFGCDSLVNLFPTNPMRLLNHLETLKVSSCGSIGEIFSIDFECVTKDEQLRSSSGNLRSITVLRLKNLREVWRIRGGECSLRIHGFEAIKNIFIEGCVMFRSVFTPPNTKFDSRAVEDISIDCLKSGNAFLPRTDDNRDDNISSAAFSSSTLLYSFQYFHELYLYSCDVEVVFEIESGPSSRDMVTTTNNRQSLLPNLQHLKLTNMWNMSHVWKCNNWNNLHKQSSFNSLTSIRLTMNNRIKYLFSPRMAKLLLNLKEINIVACDCVEEVVSNRDDDKDENVTTSTIIDFFPHLQSLFFALMKNLKRIGGGGETRSIFHDQVSHKGGVPWSLCQFSREIIIHSCASLIEVFETRGINSDIGGINSPAIPRLENINLFNIKKLEIKYCCLLEHVFTFSTLESLTQLKELTVGGCVAMEVIVKKENEEQRKDVEFPRLKSLKLIDLPNLKGFFLGENEFNWPLLDKVTISGCPQMMVFTIGRSTTTPELKYIHTSLGKHSFECGVNFHVTTDLHQTGTLASSESTSLCSTTLLKRLPWSFHNLIELCVEFDSSVKKIIPSNELLQLQKLERIRVFSCSEADEVFEVKAMEGINTSSKTVVQIPNLRQMELELLYNLTYLWKSNHHHVLEFPNLTTLTIYRCKHLKHVFTSSMVGSLKQLQDLHILCCHSLLVIVNVEEEEDEEEDDGQEEEEEDEKGEVECDVKIKGIVLPCLKSIKLEELKSLKRFCLGKDDFSFPSLHTLKINGCPEITVFAKGHVDTPALKVFDTSFRRCYLREDINSFIKTRKKEGINIKMKSGSVASVQFTSVED